MEDFKVQATTWLKNLTNLNQIKKLALKPNRIEQLTRESRDQLLQKKGPNLSQQELRFQSRTVYNLWTSKSTQKSSFCSKRTSYPNIRCRKATHALQIQNNFNSLITRKVPWNNQISIVKTSQELIKITWMTRILAIFNQDWTNYLKVPRPKLLFKTLNFQLQA